MKRKFLIPLMAALALTLLLSGASQAFVLSGTNLDVGVSAGGGMVDLNAADAFPGDNGQGITLKNVPASATPNDYTAPGIPFEFFSIKAGGAFDTSGVTGVFSDLNPFGLTTTDFSAGTTNQASSFGPAFTLGTASLIYTQHITFDDSFTHVHVSVDILNNGLTDITDLKYTRGMDPDQDVGPSGEFRTLNTISGSEVTALALNSKLFVTMRDLTPGIDPVASISGPLGGGWVTNPDLLTGGGVNGATAGAYQDASINLTYDIGFLAHGTSIQLDFEYEFGVPVPPTVWLLGSGLLGLVGLRFRRKSA